MGLNRIFCCGNLSFGNVDANVSEESNWEIVQTISKRMPKITRAEMLSQEMDELDEKLQLLANTLDVLEGKYEDTEHQMIQFAGMCLVEKLERTFSYTAPPIIVVKKRNDGTSFLFFNEVIDEIENPSAKEPNSANDARQINIVHQVQSLLHSCKRMFFRDGKSTEGTSGRRFSTDLAMQYNSVALKNVIRGVHNFVQLPPLRKLCYMMLDVEKTGVDNKELQKADGNEKLAIQPTGNFGQTNTVGFGLAIERRHFKENLCGASGLLKITQPLQTGQAVLHHEILKTVDFPFRISLRDIMFGNRCLEIHAKFLCMSLLMTIDYLHNQNIIHGNIKLSTVSFTQLGYPCLIGVQSDVTDKESSGAQPCVEYSSPEQVKAEPISAATDIFLTGIVVYSTIYGKSPFKAETFTKTRANILDETFIPEFDPDTFSKDGRLFTRKLLKMNPENRFKLDSCTKPLDKAVKWFSTMSQPKLRNQTYPSPFKEILMK